MVGLRMETNKVKFIAFKTGMIKITLSDDMLWRSEDGTIWALADDTASVDSTVRCGVGLLSLPEDSPLTPGCKVHDYLYSSPAYQLFHTRAEADRYLRRQIKLISGNRWYRVFAEPFKWLSEKFGGRYWENDKTR